MSRRHRQGTRVNEGPYRCELAAEIVRKTACSFCGATPNARCVSSPKAQPMDTGRRWGKVLAPSQSHRARIEAYWKDERDAS